MSRRGDAHCQCFSPSSDEFLTEPAIFRPRPPPGPSQPRTGPRVGCAWTDRTLASASLTIPGADAGTSAHLVPLWWGWGSILHRMGRSGNFALKSEILTEVKSEEKRSKCWRHTECPMGRSLTGKDPECLSNRKEIGLGDQGGGHREGQVLDPDPSLPSRSYQTISYIVATGGQGVWVFVSSIQTKLIIEQENSQVLSLCLLFKLPKLTYKSELLITCSKFTQPPFFFNEDHKLSYSLGHSHLEHSFEKIMGQRTKEINSFSDPPSRAWACSNGPFPAQPRTWPSWGDPCPQQHWPGEGGVVQPHGRSHRAAVTRASRAGALLWKLQPRGFQVGVEGMGLAG